MVFLQANILSSCGKFSCFIWGYGEFLSAKQMTKRLNWVTGCSWGVLHWSYSWITWNAFLPIKQLTEIFIKDLQLCFKKGVEFLRHLGAEWKSGQSQEWWQSWDQYIGSKSSIGGRVWVLDMEPLATQFLRHFHRLIGITGKVICLGIWTVVTNSAPQAGTSVNEGFRVFLQTENLVLWRRKTGRISLWQKSSDCAPAHEKEGWVLVYSCR